MAIIHQLECEIDLRMRVGKVDFFYRSFEAIRRYQRMEDCLNWCFFKIISIDGSVMNYTN
ncbi:hypothetical protein E5S67_03260 [Microcoleus sp. IPMA8]|uniref:Transposase n=1 Tax=Microcoleus asticus IPMA8 TaxID=2563858 RepID=A0ABX2D1I0_9CYAN|nr:hypothetical protein [Microcoleus asticus IPMA8]